MEHPTTSQWNIAETSQWYVFTASYWYVATTPQGDVMTTSHQYVSTTSQISLKWNTQRRLSGTSPRRLSGTYPERTICTSPVHNISCNSQMKHSITSLWYVSTMSQSYVVATPCLYYGLYYVFKLLCRNLQLVGFQVSFKHQIKHHIFLVPKKKKKRGVVWIIN